MSKPSPQPDGPSAEFYRRAAGGTLALQRCSDCAALRHPPRYRCARCGSDAYDWQPAAGTGRILGWTVSHRSVVPGWQDEVPFATAVVELTEGVRIVGGLRGIAPERLALDLPVVAAVEKVSDEFAFVYFMPA